MRQATADSPMGVWLPYKGDEVLRTETGWISLEFEAEFLSLEALDAEWAAYWKALA